MSGRIINIEAYDDPDRRHSRSLGGSNSSEGGRTLRAQLINHGIDRDVLTVLDARLAIGQTLTVLDTLGDDGFRSNSTTPSYSVVKAVDRALAARSLSLSQKTRLFGILGWDFECLKCNKYKKPAEFENTSFILWGASTPARPHLRSGPCIACKDKARNGRGGGIIPYTRAELGRPPQHERAALIQTKTISVVLTETIVVVSNVGHKFDQILSLAPNLGTSPTELVSRYFGAIREDVIKAVSCRATLAKFAILLEAGHYTEAQRCRARVEDAAAGMLQSNFWLGERMREMVDNGVGGGDDGSRAGPLSSGVTMRDVGKASLVPLPLVASELRFGKEFFVTGNESQLDAESEEV
ncbi:hypothetical protein Trco_007251 [Trichoderma cornu-damae]|uniref:Uncharacterized protein n=1 Tax=Trichoderma cornu-damae TaxID=654480 RepID=A0A9P8QFK1_9HYPO|nr:hypothetical protein Trco_007251 [Trichoderma cornu-damae]